MLSIVAFHQGNGLTQGNAVTGKNQFSQPVNIDHTH